MRIVIVGAGSLGSTIGGLLALADHDITLVTRNEAHVAAIVAQGGVRLHDGGATVMAPVRSATGYGAIGVVDLAIVLVKSFDTAAAITAAMPSVGPDTVVLSLQNGVGCEALIADVVGAERVVTGRTFVGGRLTEPGVVEYGVVGRDTIVGELDSAHTARIEHIATAFTDAGLATTVSDDIRVTMWDKLLVNVATGAWSALTGLSYGELSTEPHVAQAAIATVAEAMEVARAIGIPITASDPEVPWRRAWEGLPYGFKASMLQSVERGSRTEVDVIHGAVCRAGRDAGVATPINDTLLAAMWGVERRLEIVRKTQR